MNARIVFRLIVKDCSLMRIPIAAYTVAATLGLLLAAFGGASGRGAGITLALNVLIGVSFHVMLGPVLGERERKTLAFVMSLPATPRDVAVAKLWSSFILFVIPAFISATALVFLSPVDVFGAMAASDRSVLSHLLGWAGFYALVLGAWLLFFSVILAVAIVGESIGWTIAALTGSTFVFGNVVIQVASNLRWVSSYIRDVTHGGTALPVSLAVEALGLTLVVAAMLILQGRKTSFV